MVEVDYGGGGHHTRLRDKLVCLWGAPSLVYKGVEEGEGRPLYGAPPPRPAAPSPLILYIRGQGAPLDTTIDLLIS